MPKSVIKKIGKIVPENEKTASGTKVQDSGERFAIKFLNDDDLPQYLNAGNRKNKYKQEAIDEGKKIILTSKEETEEYIRRSIAGEKGLPVVAYGIVDEKLAEDTAQYSKDKIKINDYYMELVAYDIHHAYNEHLNAKKTGDIDLSLDDFAQIPYYVATYDDFLYAIKYKSGTTKICVSKKVDDGRILIIETVSKSHGSIEFKNLIGVSEEKYISDYVKKYKKGNVSSGGNKSSNTSPHNTTAFYNSIPQKSQNSNTSDKNSSKDFDSGERSALPDAKKTDKTIAKAEEKLAKKEIRLRAEYKTDTVFSESGIKKRLAAIDGYKHLPASERSDIEIRLR